MSSKEQRKTSFDVFNKEAKRVLKDMRDMFPSLSGIGLLLVALKVTKHMGGRRVPHRVLNELVIVPFKSRFDSRDAAFFCSDAFVVPGHEEFVETLKPLWRDLDDGAREVVWRRMADLIAVHVAASDLQQRQ